MLLRVIPSDEHYIQILPHYEHDLLHYAWQHSSPQKTGAVSRPEAVGSVLVPTSLVTSFTEPNFIM